MIDFEKIYKEFYQDVYRLIYSYLLNKEDTEDVLENTFLKLYLNINKFKNKNLLDIEKWLFRVAINNCKNHLKSAWIKKRIFNYRFEESKNYQKQDDLIIYLSKISIMYRTPLFLYYYYGYSINEIVKILNLSESNVKQRLKRGREVLKKEMSDYK